MGDDLARRLAEPAVAERLGGLLDRLDKIEALVDAFGTFATRLPQLGDMLGDTTAFVQREARARDLDPLERGPEWLALGQKALSRDQVARLDRLLDLAPRLDKLLDIAATVDPADLATLSAELPRVASMVRRPETRRLLDALDGPALDFAARVLSATRDVPAASAGPWAALRAAGEAPIRRALGFALGAARRFGAGLGG